LYLAISNSGVEYGSNNRMKRSADTILIYGREAAGATWMARLLQAMGMEVSVTGELSPNGIDSLKPAFVAQGSPSNATFDYSKPNDRRAEILVFGEPKNSVRSPEDWISEANAFLSLADSCPSLLIDETALISNPSAVVAMLKKQFGLELDDPQHSPDDEVAAAWTATARIFSRDQLWRASAEKQNGHSGDGLPPVTRELLRALIARADIKEDGAPLPLEQLIPRNSSSPRIAVIIPCFNDGIRLLEALASVRCCDAEQIEVVVIDDGSTDPFTIHLLKQLESSGLSVFWLEHRTTAAARNSGIKRTSAPYILPLDADNLIRRRLIADGIARLEADSQLAMTHSDAAWFGERQGRWIVEPFELRRLLRGNYIDACAVVRRKALEQVGGYTDALSSLEDWDLWLKFAAAGWGFRKLDFIGFDYRVRKDSKVRISAGPDRRRDLFLDVARYNQALFAPWWPVLYNDALDAIAILETRIEELEAELGQLGASPKDQS